MGEAAKPITNWATHFVPSVQLDATPPPANDTAPPKTPAETPEYKWIHCANVGEYLGHHQGPFVLTRAVFETFVKNFRDSPQYKAGSLDLSGTAYTGGVRPVIQFDYEHASEMPPWEGSIPKEGAPAPAWVLEVEVRDDAEGKAQLWAFAQLGPTIRRQIAAREYLWVSIAFTQWGVHWVTGVPIGWMLTSIAFTNHPFMQDLEALAASSRATSQPPRGAVRSEREPSEAPNGGRDQSRTGATMDQKLRDRLCKALKINLAASDEQVGEAVDEAVGKTGNLDKVLAALGVENTGDALQTIPKLRTALQQVEGVAKELRDLLSGEQAADAEIAKVDAQAAMRAQGAQGDSIQLAFIARRQHLLGERTAAVLNKADRPKGPDKLPVPLSLAEWRDCVKSARTDFLKEYGADDPAKGHLTESLVAGPNGTQLSAPTDRALPVSDRNDGSTGGGPKVKIDVTGFGGRNKLERVINHQLANDKTFAALPWTRKVERAAGLLTSAEIVGA